MAYLAFQKLVDKKKGDVLSDPTKNLSGPSAGPSGGGPASAASLVRPQQAAQQQGASPTGFVEFGQILRANEDVSRREATNLANRISQLGESVAPELAEGQKKFGAGVVSGLGDAKDAPSNIRPSDSPQAPSIPTKDMGKTPPGGKWGTVQQSLMSEEPPTQVDPSSWEVTGYTYDEAKRRAGQKYTGPGSLADSMGGNYYALLERSRDAEARARALQSGSGVAALLSDYQNASKAGEGYAPGGGRTMDAALLQAVGRGRFSEVGDRLAGTEDSLLGANISSAQRAGEARGMLESWADKWQALVDKEAKWREETVPQLQKTADEEAAMIADERAVKGVAYGDSSNSYLQRAADAYRGAVALGGSSQRFATEKTWGAATAQEKAAMLAHLDRMKSQHGSEAWWNTVAEYESLVAELNQKYGGR